MTRRNYFKYLEKHAQNKSENPIPSTQFYKGSNCAHKRQLDTFFLLV